MSDWVLAPTRMLENCIWNRLYKELMGLPLWDCNTHWFVLELVVVQGSARLGHRSHLTGTS